MSHGLYRADTSVYRPRMLRSRGALSVSVLAASQLLYSPAGHAQAPPTAARSMPGPIVTLRADNMKARLQIFEQKLTWQDVCLAPCNVPVNPWGIYRVGGGTIRPSATFSLPRKPSVVIDAKVGSTVKHGVGLGLIVGGIVTAVGGGVIYTSADDDQPDPYGSNAPKTIVHIYGVFFMVVGALLLAVGIPLSLSSTSVEVH